MRAAADVVQQKTEAGHVDDVHEEALTDDAEVLCFDGVWLVEAEELGPAADAEEHGENSGVWVFEAVVHAGGEEQETAERHADALHCVVSGEAAVSRIYDGARLHPAGDVLRVVQRRY